MIRPASTIPSGSRLEADVCIVGAGAAGIAIARRLASERTSVLVLEAGNRGISRESQSFYDGTASGDTDDLFLTDSRLRQLGGTTNHWGGHVYPLEPIDFEERDWVPESGWPIERAELEPYFGPAAEMLGLDAVPDRGTRDSTAALGFLESSFETREFRIAPVRFASRFAPTLAATASVETLTGAAVFELTLDESRSHVAGVVVHKSKDETFTVRAGRFVLASGGIENARLLLLNGIAAERDVVGRYFMFHPALVRQEVHFGMAHREAVESCHTLGRRQGFLKLALREDEQRRHRITNVHLRLRPLRRGGEPLRRVPSVLANTGGLDRFHSLNLGLHAEQPPSRSNRVTLGEERDAYGYRKVHVHWERGEAVERAALETVRLFGQGLGSRRAGRYFRGARLDGKWAVTPAHQLGTTRMHADERRGVVNADCRVHGVRNLFVAGGSLFTTGGAANPTFTILALALRLADHLNEGNRA